MSDVSQPREGGEDERANGASLAEVEALIEVLILTGKSPQGVTTQLLMAFGAMLVDMPPDQGAEAIIAKAPELVRHAMEWVHEQRLRVEQAEGEA